MQKIIIAIAAIAFALGTSIIAKPAHAGMKGKIAVGLAIGALGVMAAHSHRHHAEQRRAAKRKYYARKKSNQKTYVAKKNVTAPKQEYVAETVAPEDVPLPEQKVASEIVTENSSITTAALTDTNPVYDDVDVNDDANDNATNVSSIETGTTDEPETVGSLGCKKFFPAVGMTLSVPCETSNAQ